MLKYQVWLQVVTRRQTSCDVCSCFQVTNGNIDHESTSCCNTTTSQAFYGGFHEGPTEALAPYCFAGCVSLCFKPTSHSVHCCIGSSNNTMPPTPNPEPTTPEPTTPEPTTTTTTPTTTTKPQPCTDCTCMPIWYGSYGSVKISKPGHHFCCSRSDSPAFDSCIYFLYYSMWCPTSCVAKCGDKYHCCKGSPRTTTTTTTRAPSICFPSKSSLNLKNGKSVTMSQLQVGDEVQTGRGIDVWLYNMRKILQLIILSHCSH